MLTLINRWHEDGRSFARWFAASQTMLRNLKLVLGRQLKAHLSRRCAHVQGRGGVKDAVRYVHKLADHYCFAALRYPGVL